MKKFALAAALVALSSTSAMAATANGVVSATLATPITVTHATGSALNFGTIIEAGTATGTIVLNASGATSATPAAASITNSATLQSVTGATLDSFSVAGAGNAAYSVTIAAANPRLTPNLTFGTFTTSLPASGAALVAGAGTFYVGGTLTWNGTADTGTIANGSYTVTVNYL